MNLDTSIPIGKLLLTMLGAVYQFEREILLERQLVGIAKAKREGKSKGRVPTAKRKSGDIQRLLRDGLKPQEIAAELEFGLPLFIVSSMAVCSINLILYKFKA